MRKREWSGKAYYYLRSTIDGKRNEIPLGSDFILALKKYSELVVIDVPQHSVKFSDLEKKYPAEVAPKQARNTAKIYRSNILHLSI